MHGFDREKKTATEMVLPLHISGWSGEHDETGAQIVDATGKYICHTREVEGNSPEAWYAYQKIPADIVLAVNTHQKLLNALKAIRISTDSSGIKEMCDKAIQLGMTGKAETK